MLGFDGPVGEVSILDEDGKPVTADDQASFSKPAGCTNIMVPIIFPIPQVLVAAALPQGQKSDRACVQGYPVPGAGWTISSVVEFRSVSIMTTGFQS
jgi:hypothetical protein